MSELIKRTLSGAIYVACVVGSILYSPYAFGLLLLLVTCLAVNEFHKLMKSSRISRSGGIVCALLLCGGAICFSVLPRDLFLQNSWGVYGLIGVCYSIILIATLIDELWEKSEHPVQNWGTLLVSQVMIALPFCSMALLFHMDKWLLLAVFVLLWVNDTGAYCVGCLTAKLPNGNHKMFPRVSPKKSWEGLIGGIVFSLLAALILHHFGWFDKIAANDYGMVIALVFAVVACAFGTLGDLMESLMKRSIGVKDSGRFLPGHGGVLDRFDSLLLATPMLTIYCFLCYAISSLL